MMKNWKSIFALLLTLAMLFALAACGGTPAAEKPAAEEPAAEEPAAEEPAAEEPAAEAPAAEEPSAEEPANELGEPVVLTAATSMKETDALGAFWFFFKDYVEEASAGNITIDLYHSGSLGGAGEYLEMMKNDTLDLCANYAPFNAFLTPAFVTVLNGLNSPQEALDYAKYIAFEDPDSSAVFAAESAEYNATLLGNAMPCGYHVYVSSKEVGSFTELMETAKLGSVSESCYTQMGFKSFVTIDPTSVYESLRTGVCDCVDYDAGTIISQKLYELGKTAIICPLYPVMDFYCVNTNTWNSLTEGQQAILTDAAQKTMEYAVTYIEDLIAGLEKSFEDNGATIVKMTDEEFAAARDINITFNYASMLVGLGGATGKTEDLIPCVKAGLTFYAENYGCDFGDIDEFINTTLGR